MSHHFFSRFLVLLLLLGYWAVSLDALTVLPRPYEDEAWQASTGWKLATQGIFGSDLFAGYHRMEQRYYGFMPLHPILVGLVLRAAGYALFQARLESVACGLIVLTLTYALAARLFHDARIGGVALILLLFVRTLVVSPLHVTGVLFLDAVRISRYDIVVPLFGLLALHAYVSARSIQKPRWYFLSGLLCALAGLAHLYGTFFLLIILLLTMWDRRRGREPQAANPNTQHRTLETRGAIGYVLIGFALPWLGYLAYVLTDLDAWRAQTRMYGERFDVLKPQWYFENMRRELSRYSFGITIPFLSPVQVGLWANAVALPLAWIGLGWRAWQKKDRAARVIFLPTLVLPVLFALLLRVKFTNYLFTLIPFVALTVAWGAACTWDFLGRIHGGRWARIALLLIGAAIILEGVLQVASFHPTAQLTNPYAQVIGAVRANIPPGARVAGLPNYAFGWNGYDYRSITVPLLLADPISEAQPIPLGIALDAQAPEYILMDERLRAYFEENKEGIGGQFAAWLSTRKGRVVARTKDPSYGVFEMYRLGP